VSPTETQAPLSVYLHEPDGTLVGELTGKVAASYQDRIGDPGSAQVTMRQSDAQADLIVPRSIIKYGLLGDIRFGARVGIENADYEDTDATVTWTCLGLGGAILSDAVVLDENGGIRANSTGQRWLGWMSSLYDDTVTGWITTLAGTSFQWDDATSQSAARLGNPVDWPDPEAWWLHRGSFGGQYQLFRRDFTTADDLVLKLWATADEGLRVYFDGELVLDVLGTNAPDETGYTDSNETELGIVNAGAHHVAVEWRGKVTPITGDGFDGFILTIGYVDDTGGYAGNVTRSDDSGAWRSYGGVWEDPRPGLLVGAALAGLWEEADARGVAGMQIATLGFTDTLDSAGQPWTSQVNTAINLADQNYDAVFYALAEAAEIDLWFDADTMTLHAYERKGADLSGSVAVKRGVPNTVELGDGANVTDLKTSRDVQVLTDLYGQLSDGTYQQTFSSGACSSGTPRSVTAPLSSSVSSPSRPSRSTPSRWGRRCTGRRCTSTTTWVTRSPRPRTAPARARPAARRSPLTCQPGPTMPM
jgi:hypothetical protein